MLDNLAHDNIANRGETRQPSCRVDGPFWQPFWSLDWLRQPAPSKDRDIETVTVTAERIPAEVVRAFVQSYAHIVSSSLEKITRWKKPICVGADGLSAEELNQFVTNRVQRIATKAGVPVLTFPCRINVEIVFTSDPQGFLDKVRVEGPHGRFPAGSGRRLCRHAGALPGARF